ncbi:MAG TPA: SPFH domain-containing protein [Candidatus Dormibacteraeota bacterium]|nr:SPFH domain-containing protein [Candidatus Dormibacteraeota bacterium]
MGQIVSVVVAALIVVLVVMFISRMVRQIQQGTVGVVKRLGQYRSIRNPGVTFLAPFIDRMERVEMREVPRTGDRQDVITKDNVSVQVNATIFSQVIDPRLALFGVSNYFVAIDQLARSSLRAVFGEMTLDDALSQREQINARLQARMESETDKWGVRINRVEIIDIVPPGQILQAMALQKQADQEKRAAILQSEGQQQSQINLAEGQKQAQIKQAEGQRQAAILYAEGQKQAAILEAEGRAQAIGTVYGAIKAGAPTPELLAVLQLDTLGKFAGSPNSKMLVPYESAGLLGAAQALRSVLSEVPEAASSDGRETPRRLGDR